MKQYYLALSGQPPQVVTVEQLHDLLQKGQASPETLVVEVGGSQWATVKGTFPHLFQRPTPTDSPDASRWLQPPPPLPVLLPPPEEEDGFLDSTVEALGNAGRVVGTQSTRLAVAMHAFATRIMASNFTIAHASEKERIQLEAATVPIRTPMAQNYAAWRRAMLWFASFGLVINAITFTYNYIAQLIKPTNIGDGLTPDVIEQLGVVNTRILNTVLQSPGITTFMDFLLLLFSIAAPICVIMAAQKWTNVKKSRRLAWIGWLCVFIAPFFVFFLPIPALMSNNFGLGGSMLTLEGYSFDMAPVRRGVWSAAGILFALTSLAPHVISMFPGILRSCVTLRTLVPESPLPGWICMLVSPLYALIFAIVVVIALQSNHIVLGLGLACILGLPLLTLFNFRHLAQPMSVDDMNASLKRFKHKQSILQWAGIILILIAASSYFKEIGWWRFTSVSIELISNIFFMTMVGADFILGLMRLAHEQSKTLQSSPLFTELDRRYVALSQVELTDFSTVPAPSTQSTVIIP